MIVRYEGQAQAGDLLITPWGETRLVLSVVSAGDLIEAVVERRIAMRAPNFYRDSVTAQCALFASTTTGREKRNYERLKQRRDRSAA